MIVYSDITGREFDWFGTDSVGCVALFATAGAGIIPAPVLADYLAHDKLSDLFPVEHWGSEKVWDVYARLGLYVYDWDDCGGNYRRLRVPSSAMTEELRESFRHLSSLPRFEFRFENRTIIDLVGDACLT